MIEIIYLIVLFFLITPGVLWSYSKKTNKYVIALVHASIFAMIWKFSHKEGVKDKKKEKKRNVMEFLLLDELYKDEELKNKIRSTYPEPVRIASYETNDPVPSSIFVYYNKNGVKNKLNITKADILDKTNIHEFKRVHENDT
jgi:hypothetical protein